SREALDAVIPGGGADVFENDIHSPFARYTTDFVLDFLRAMVNEIVGAEFPGLGQLGVAACAGNDPAAQKLCDLYGGGADAAAGAQYQHGLGWLQLGTRKQHVPSGLENERDRGGFLKRKIFGIRKAIDFGAAHKLRAPAIDQITQIGE